MRKENNIDRIFSEGLANYSESPPAFVWDAISDGMQGAKQNKKILLLWRGAAAAAIIGLIFLAGLFWNNTNNTLADANLKPQGTAMQQLDLDTMGANEIKANIDEIIDEDQKNPVNFTQKQNKTSQNLTSNNNKLSESKTQSLASSNKASSVYNKPDFNITDKKSADKTTGAQNNANEKMQPIASEEDQTYAQIITPIITEGTDIEKNKTPLLKKMDAQAMHNLADYSAPNTMRLKKNTDKPVLKSNETDNWILAFDNHKPLKPSDKKGLEFALGGQFSPSYSNNDAGQSDGSSAAAANEDGIMSYTGGINLNIKTRKRWEIETGVYYSQIGQKFSNPIIGKPDKIIYTASPGAGIQSKKPNLNNSMGNISLESTAQQELVKDVAISNAAIRLNSNDLAYSPTQVEAITVQQELEYLEIPFLLRYNLLNKSVGLSVSGGMSTNFLIGNNAYRLENSSKNRIGETQDINEISYSAIFGFGFRAPILKSLDFNLEPRIKYFMNSVTDSPESSYKPYSIGIYTGVSYHF